MSHSSIITNLSFRSYDSREIIGQMYSLC